MPPALLQVLREASKDSLHDVPTFSALEQFSPPGLGNGHRQQESTSASAISTPWWSSLFGWSNEPKTKAEIVAKPARQEMVESSTSSGERPLGFMVSEIYAPPKHLTRDDSLGQRARQENHLQLRFSGVVEQEPVAMQRSAQHPLRCAPEGAMAYECRCEDSPEPEEDGNRKRAWAVAERYLGQLQRVADYRRKWRHHHDVLMKRKNCRAATRESAPATHTPNTSTTSSKSRRVTVERNSQAHGKVHGVTVSTSTTEKAAESSHRHRPPVIETDAWSSSSSFYLPKDSVSGSELAGNHDAMTSLSQELVADMFGGPAEKSGDVPELDQDCLGSRLAKAIHDGKWAGGRQARSKEPMHRLRVTIQSAHGLKAADFGGTSDPYCICDVPGKKSARLKTPVIKKTLNPVWNFVCELNLSSTDSLQFSVWDQDLASEELLGSAYLDSVQFIQTGFEGRLALSDVRQKMHSTLSVKIEPLGQFELLEPPVVPMKMPLSPARLAKRYSVPVHEVFERKEEFETLDKEKAGALSRDQFLEALKQRLNVNHVEDITDRHLEDIIRSTDADGSGSIDFEEYLAWTQAVAFSEEVNALTPAEKTIRDLARFHGQDNKDVDYIWCQFHQFIQPNMLTKNKGGALTEDEWNIPEVAEGGTVTKEKFDSLLQSLLGAIHTGDIPQARLDRFWKEAAGNDRAIGFNQFLAWYLKYFTPSNNAHASTSSLVYESLGSQRVSSFATTQRMAARADALHAKTYTRNVGL